MLAYDIAYELPPIPEPAPLTWTNETWRGCWIVLLITDVISDTTVNFCSVYSPELPSFYKESIWAVRVPGIGHEGVLI
jgi:hypothetical protein